MIETDPLTRIEWLEYRMAILEKIVAWIKPPRAGKVVRKRPTSRRKHNRRRADIARQAAVEQAALLRVKRINELKMKNETSPSVDEKGKVK